MRKWVIRTVGHLLKKYSNALRLLFLQNSELLSPCSHTHWYNLSSPLHVLRGVKNPVPLRRQVFRNADTAAAGFLRLDGVTLSRSVSALPVFIPSSHSLFLLLSLPYIFYALYFPTCFFNFWKDKWLSCFESEMFPTGSCVWRPDPQLVTSLVAEAGEALGRESLLVRRLLWVYSLVLFQGPLLLIPVPPGAELLLPPWLPCHDGPNPETMSPDPSYTASDRCLP